MKIVVLVILLVGTFAKAENSLRHKKPPPTNNDDIKSIISKGKNLELVHVVFRHGDRTPERLYPTDPYTAASFFPIGVGQLTIAGKNRTYNLGVDLRKKYNAFLGSVYYPEIVEALSSHSPRCKNSLLALLAGLFPPQKSEVWNPDLNWQPIPFNTFTSSQNKMFAPFGACPGYTTLVANSMEGIYSDPNLNDYKDNVTYNYLLTNSGMTGNPGYAVDLLFSTLKSEQELGLPLPNWTQSVWPEPITKMEGHVFKYLANNNELKTIAAGYLASKIVENTKLTVANSSSATGRKIYLYSGHDANLVSLLMMMDNFEPHCPPYGAYLTFEIHNISGTRYMKITYNDYSKSAPREISLPGCGKHCTFDDFVTKYSVYMNATVADSLCGTW